MSARCWLSDNLWWSQIKIGNKNISETCETKDSSQPVWSGRVQRPVSNLCSCSESSIFLESHQGVWSACRTEECYKALSGPDSHGTSQGGNIRGGYMDSSLGENIRQQSLGKYPDIGLMMIWIELIDFPVPWSVKHAKAPLHCYCPLAKAVVLGFIKMVALSLIFRGVYPDIVSAGCSHWNFCLLLRLMALLPIFDWYVGPLLPALGLNNADRSKGNSSKNENKTNKNWNTMEIEKTQDTDGLVLGREMLQFRPNGSLSLPEAHVNGSWKTTVVLP